MSRYDMIKIIIIIQYKLAISMVHLILLSFNLSHQNKVKP